MIENLFEKLQLADEKNILIQGLPYSLEKYFNKLSFAKNITPILRRSKIDFALIFAVTDNQLNNILKDVMPALKENSKFWVAFPKNTSKIDTNLNRSYNWRELSSKGYESIDRIELDQVWSAIMFIKNDSFESKSKEKCLLIEMELPEDISNETAKQLILKVALLADAEHRIQGGKGLKINDIRIKQFFPVSQEITI